MDAGVVKGGFGVEEGWAVVADEEDEGAVGHALSLERFEDQADAGVDTGDGAVVLCELLSRFWEIGDPGWSIDVLSLELGARNSVTVLLLAVTEFSSRFDVPVRIYVADGKVEGLVGVLGVLEECFTSVCNPRYVPSTALLLDLPWVDIVSTDMDFPNNASLVASMVEQLRDSIDVPKCLEVGLHLIESVLSILMRKDSRVHRAPATTAAGGGAECHVELRSRRCHPVQVRRLDRLAAIAPNVFQTQIVSNDEDDVLLLGGHVCRSPGHPAWL